ncbi:MAG TPA: putative dsRNA-binding protein, partial [Rhizobiaceae bacterium]|nr:putative dsRNA-binding protein [Rhizobiaceae bacterium]
VEVSVPGREPAAAVGRSKRLAEQSAAETPLLREGVWMECATQ